MSRVCTPLLALTFMLAACGKHEPHSAAPPPAAPPAKQTLCSGGGGTVDDSLAAPLFPRVVEAYCVDPQGETRTYGDQAKHTLGEVCTTAFDGDCAVYSQMGLRRLVSLRYVGGAAGDATVEVYLSRFDGVAGAYAMYTKRVVGEGDPADPSIPKPFAAGGAASMGTGRAYVWKDRYLVELEYTNDQETPEVLAQSSAHVLRAMGVAIGAQLPGTPEIPPPVAALPLEHRLASGVQLVLRDGLGIAGLGPLAIGYYDGQGTRYRLYAFAAADDGMARQAWKGVRGCPGALPVAGVGDEAVVVTPKAAAAGSPAREDVLARKGTLIAGIGDEELAQEGLAHPLTRSQKVATLRVWLDSRGSTHP